MAHAQRAVEGGETETVIALVPDPPDVAAARSFEAVYRASYARMIRVAYLMTGSNEAAEEVVQDAFLALFQRFASVAEPDGYLYRSVVNGCRSRHRRQALADRLRPTRPQAAATPPELDETWEALRMITPRRRSAIVLRYYADLPLTEIAQVLECSTGTVKSLLHRGLAQLKDVIEP
jgi:RNA polymerase sigma factor (sigma-70 family)